MEVYGDLQSGNCYKIKLLLSFLEIDHDWKHIDILAGETKSPEFLQMNPNGKIPVVTFNDGRILCESNAILGYFAEGTSFIPTEKFSKAKVYEWLFFEQYSHEPYIAVARFIRKYQGMPESRKTEFLSLQNGGNKALQILDTTLAKNSYLVGDYPTIADISLYAYTHVADEGGFDLQKYPSVQRWCRRIEATANYLPMQE